MALMSVEELTQLIICHVVVWGEGELLFPTPPTIILQSGELALALAVSREWSLYLAWAA